MVGSCFSFLPSLSSLLFICSDDFFFFSLLHLLFVTPFGLLLVYMSVAFYPSCAFLPDCSLLFCMHVSCHCSVPVSFFSALLSCLDSATLVDKRNITLSQRRSCVELMVVFLSMTSQKDRHSKDNQANTAVRRGGRVGSIWKQERISE